MPACHRQVEISLCRSLLRDQRLCALDLAQVKRDALHAVAARGGRIILMTDAKGAAEATIESLVTIVLPDMAATFTPMVYAVPVQLLAYHTAVVMGTDVDQPRNLAKSVTVE